MSVEKRANNLHYYCDPTIKWDIDDYYIHSSMEINTHTDDIEEKEVTEILTLWEQLNEMT